MKAKFEVTIHNFLNEHLTGSVYVDKNKYIHVFLWYY